MLSIISQRSLDHLNNTKYLHPESQISLKPSRGISKNLRDLNPSLLGSRKEFKENVNTIRSFYKLGYQHNKPLFISNKINEFAFHCDLLSHMRIHRIFYISLLKLCASSSILGQVVAPPSPNIRSNSHGQSSKTSFV